MEVLVERCCGLDVHQATVVACVRRPGPRGRRTAEVRTFGTMTAALLSLADWLTAEGVTPVALESTGVFWKPGFNILEGQCAVILVNAHHIKAVPGRKTDVRDCEWLAQLLEHGLLEEILAHSEYLEGTIGRLDRRMAAVIAPYADHVAHLQSIPGVDRDAAETLVAEVGVDMTCFPRAGHLASWVGICPGNYESAGKRQRGTTRKGNRWLKTMLVECGWGAGRARRTYLGAQYARLSRRRGKKKAAMAVGHSILVAAFYILRDGVPYRDLGPDHFDRLASQRLTRHYVHRLEQLGHRVTIEPAA